MKQFGGFDHIDTRVRNLALVETFYDRLMPALGLTEKRRCNVIKDDWQSVEGDGPYNAIEYFEPKVNHKPPCFIGFIEDPTMIPTLTRIAFRVDDAGTLHEWRQFLERSGAKNIEMSADMQNYPAVFFEDPAGTKLELCARP